MGKFTRQHSLKKGVERILLER